MIGYELNLIPRNLNGEEVLENANTVQVALGNLFWRDPVFGEFKLTKNVYTIIIPPEGLLTHFVSAHSEWKHNLDLHSGITFNKYLANWGLNIMPELEHSSQHMADSAINFSPVLWKERRGFQIKRGLTVTFSAMYLYALRTFVKRHIIHPEQVVINHLYLDGFSLKHAVISVAKDGGYIGDLPSSMPENQLELLLFSLL